jgi:hypothetical protein
LVNEQKTFYYNQNLEREVNNGGFNQYFFNSAGKFAMETIESLKAIGAHRTKDILQTAINQFHGNIPADPRERQEKLEQIDEGIWEELDTKFFAYEDDLNSLNFEYIKNHKDKF